MIIKQFEDKNFAHYSYAILSGKEIALIDPSRDPKNYFDFAEQNEARISAIIETHPHADFISGHLEIYQTIGAPIYVSRLVEAEYDHKTFDEGDTIIIGKIILKAINTPGHSPDSISIIVYDENGIEQAVFTGDTLFIGDCGRPDLREQAGNETATRETLARQMYYSLRNKLMKLPDSVTVYPAHGAGSLCGKALSPLGMSTIGQEKQNNWSLQQLDESSFVNELLADQPFIPKYFSHAVDINKKGAASLTNSLSKIKISKDITSDKFENEFDPSILIIDTRPQELFKLTHLKNSYNLMLDLKFETWLGSIVSPGEPFYLIAEFENELENIFNRISKIGYEHQIRMAFTLSSGNSQFPFFDCSKLLQEENEYAILDVRNIEEVKQIKLFEKSINIPLYELRERIAEIPNNKPILVHCAGGFRSAAGSSIIKSQLNDILVFDLSTDVKNFY